VFGKKFFKQRMNQPIAARTINQFAGPLDGLMKMRGSPGAGIVVQWVAGIPYTRLAGMKFTNLRMVYTQTGGIPFATSATVGTVVTLTPGSAFCFDSFYNVDNKSVVDTSGTPALLVYNDFTSATNHQNAGVGGQWVMVGDAANGTTRLVGDPCP
jgi:hypothetical protein